MQVRCTLFPFMSPWIRRNTRFPQFALELWGRRASLIGTVALMLFHTLLILSLPIPLKWLLDGVILRSETFPLWLDFLNFYPPKTQILYLFLSFIGLIGITATTFYTMSLGAARTAFRLTLALRQNLLQRLFWSKLTYVERQTRAQWTQHFSGDLGNIQDVVIDGLFALVVAIPTLLMITGILFWTSPLLANLVLGTLLLTAALTVVLSVIIRRQLREYRSTLINMDDSIFQAIGAMPLIKTLSASQSVERAIDRIFTHNVRSHLKVIRLQSIYDVCLHSTRNVLRSIVLLFGGWLVLDGHLSVGSLVLFVSYVESTSQPLNLVSKFITKWNKASVCLERVEQSFRELNEQMEIRAVSTKNEPIEELETLAFHEVNFAYPDSNLILQNFSWGTQAGKVIALTGPSGSGKSSFCHLLLRLLEPTQGQILWNGDDVRGMNLEGYRNRFSVAFQDPLVLSATVRENLLLGLEERNITDTQIHEALKSVNALEVIESLSQGLQTQIGEGGRKLSGGERQRLMLARTFLKPNASIYILDEPSMGLDRQSQDHLFNTIKQIRSEGKLILLVSHRPEEWELADKILRFPLNLTTPMPVHDIDIG